MCLASQPAIFLFYACSILTQSDAPAALPSIGKGGTNSKLMMKASVIGLKLSTLAFLLAFSGF
jgi:hypothetical protein